MLQPAGVEVLKQIGAADGIVSDGEKVTKLVGLNEYGWKVMDLDYRSLGNEFFGVGIQRHTLSYHLQSTLSTKNHVKLHYNTCISSIESINESDNIPSDFMKEVHLKDDKNVEYGPYDLVVVAGGRNSSLRDKSIVRFYRKYPWGAYWSILPMLTGDGINEKYLQQFYKDTRRMLGFLPGGNLPGSSQKTVSVFWSLPSSEKQKFKENGLDSWKNIVNPMAPSYKPILDQITSIDDLIWAEYSDVKLKQLYCPHAPVAYVGDAGHSMSPQLGMGVTAACLDTFALYNGLLAKESSIKEGLEVFNSQRKSSLFFYHTFSHLLTPLFQSNLGPAVGLLRDISLMIPNKLPWFDQQTALTLSGYKTGLILSNKPNFPKY